MSEITRGVIGMPFELAMSSDLSRRQFYACAQRLFAENESLRGSCKAMGSDMGKLTRERNSFRAKVEKCKGENKQLRRSLEDCSDSLHSEMLQKFGGQMPDDMHPVTRRNYDCDMAEVAGYRAALRGVDPDLDTPAEAQS
jgi:hypothetical protein